MISDDRRPSLEEEEKYSDNEDLVSVNSECDRERERDARTMQQKENPQCCRLMAVEPK